MKKPMFTRKGSVIDGPEGRKIYKYINEAKKAIRTLQKIHGKDCARSVPR